MGGLREEFRLKNFGLSYHRSDVFYRPQWGIPTAVLLTYRIIIAIYCFIWLVLNLTYYNDSCCYTIAAFLTKWSFAALCLYLVTAAIIAAVHLPKTTTCCSGSILCEDCDSTELTEDDRAKWYMSLCWMFYNTACPAAILVTIMYFVLLWPKEASPSQPFPSIDNFHVHALNSVIVIFEISIVAIPTRLFHFIYGMIFGILYILTTVFYWLADRNFTLYSGMIDWSKPGWTFLYVFLAVAVATPVMHIIIFAFYKLRVFIAWKLARRNKVVDSNMVV